MDYAFTQSTGSAMSFTEDTNVGGQTRQSIDMVY